MENNIVVNRRRRKARERVMFIVLCVAIALIIIANIVAVTLAYFTDRKTGSTSLVTGTIDVVGYVYSTENSAYTTNVLTLDNDEVFPGSTTTRRIKITNNGTGTFYIRMDCELKLDLNNNGTYQTSSFLEISSIAMPSGATGSFVKSTVDQKYYYLGTLAGASSIQDIDVTLRVKPELGNSDLANSMGYQNIPYQIFLNIDVIQTANISLDTTSANAMANGWVS